MKPLVAVIVAINILVSSTQLQAQELPLDVCQSFKSPNDILSCAKKNHAQILIGQARLDEAKLGIKVAKQRPNPELEVEGLDNEDGSFSSEFTLFHTFEVGGKRGARKKVALAQQQISETELLAAKEQAIIQTALDLYRLRQLNHELAVIRENLETFKKVRKQYEQIGRLTPEQDFSVSIFQIAEEENLLRIEQLKDEKNQISSRVFLATKNKFRLTSKLLPKRRYKWPNLTNTSLKGSDIKILSDEIALSKGQYQLEKSHSWPNVSVGPRVALTNGNNDEAKFGFSLSLPLPLYQRNHAGRSKALMGLKRSELQAQLKTQELETYRDNLLNAYQRTTRALVRSQNRTSLSNRHDKLHELLDKGIVPASLIIELHREILEYYERFHEQELRAVGALWKLYALDGRILQEELK